MISIMESMKQKTKFKPKERKLFNKIYVWEKDPFSEDVDLDVALEKIVNNGRGAYYSSGSRPNQTAESWGLARLASAITGANACKVDYDILLMGCKPTSKPLQLCK